MKNRRKPLGRESGFPMRGLQRNFVKSIQDGRKFVPPSFLHKKARCVADKAACAALLERIFRKNKKERAGSVKCFWKR